MEVGTAAAAVASHDAGATLYRSYKPHDDDDDQAGHHHGVGRYPPWLRPMLSTRFFIQCNRPHHHSSPSSPTTTTATASSKATECNMFCLDCSAAICPLCVPSHRRAGHRTVQIRRSSYHDVVRVGEIQRVLDVSGVQTYVINSARVVFLNERPQTKGGKGGGGNNGGGGGSAATAANACEVCRRMLLDSFRFCSLGCKVAGTSKPKKQRLALGGGEWDSEEEGSCTTTDEHRRTRSTGSSSTSDGDERRGGFYEKPLPSAAGDQARAGSPGYNSNRKRRKGIPHRAPFGTTVVGYWY